MLTGPTFIEMERRRIITRHRMVSLSLLLVFVALVQGRAATAEVSGGSGVCRQGQRIAAKVSRVRQLEWRRPLTCREVDRQHLLERLRRQVFTQYSEESLVREGRLLALLGVLDSGEGYVDRVLAKLGQSATGFYDVESQCLYLARGRAVDAQVETMAHEMAHALQDQHFDLEKLLRPRPGRSDEQVAASALAEGDATVVARAVGGGAADALRGLAWLGALRDIFTAARGEAESDIGAYLRRSGRFAYVRGAEMVRVTHARGGWERVDGLFRRPPRSTAEVEAIASGRAFRPISVALERPRAIPRRCRLSAVETLGEQLLGQSVQRWSVTSDSTMLSGWRGDRALLFEDCRGEEELTLVARVLFRTRRNAARALAALEHAQRRRFRRGRSLERRHISLTEMERSRYVAFALEGPELLICIGFGLDESEGIIEEMRAESRATSGPAVQ